MALYRRVERFREQALASAGKRFHGRVEGRAETCSVPGCAEPGEFRAPGTKRPGFDGPGSYRWFCLDHVREFNAANNYFTGMNAEEISDAQTPYGGRERETRAIGNLRQSPPPK